MESTNVSYDIYLYIEEILLRLHTIYVKDISKDDNYCPIDGTCSNYNFYEVWEKLYPYCKKAVVDFCERNTNNITINIPDLTFRLNNYKIRQADYDIVQQPARTITFITSFDAIYNASYWIPDDPKEFADIVYYKIDNKEYSYHIYISKQIDHDTYEITVMKWNKCVGYIPTFGGIV